MTLIACISPDSNPSFLADRVISSEFGNNGFSLPSVGDRHTKVETKTRTRLHGTMCKVLRVTDSIVFLFSGEVEAAQSISTGLKRVFDGLEVKLATIRSYAEANYSNELERISLILHVYDKYGGGETWWRRCYEVEIPSVGRVLLAGSGADRAMHYLDHLPDFSQIKTSSEYAASTFCALALCGALLSDEMRTGETLGLGFGGYYDIYFSSLLGLKEITNVSYLFWFGRRHPNGDMEFNFPSKVLKKFAWEHGTGVHAVELPSPPFIEKYKWEVFFESLQKKPKLSEIPRLPVFPDLNSNWHVDCVAFDAGDAISIGLTVTFHPDRKQHMVRFLRRRDRLAFEVDTERLRNWLHKGPKTKGGPRYVRVELRN